METIATNLDKLINHAKLVKELEDKYKDNFAGHLRLRPSVGSFSLVSCADETPQAGHPDLRSEVDLKRWLKEAIQPPKREVPEKKLQSWLIQQARSDGGQIGDISALLDDQFWFVSDEIAINDPATKKKFVADMLLVRVDSDNLAQLVNVELKYDRSMKTFEQVKTFRKVLENLELYAAWQRFSEVMTGQSFRWRPLQEKTYGLVIWPKANDPLTARANKNRSDHERIGLLGFQKTETGYMLHVE
jgi:predicted DNA-binding ribbon-helix-helix protein